MVSQEIRELISKGRKDGIAVKVMEQLFRVPRRTIYGILQKETERGSMKTLEHQRGRKPAISREGLATMKSVIEEQPDITLEEIKEKMGLRISVSAICRIVHKKLGFNYKKNDTRRRTGHRKEPSKTG